MKILISCEGAPGGGSWAGLSRAGLPSSGELLVLSVANVILPDTEEETDNQWPRPYLPPSVRWAHSRAARLLEESRTCATGVGYHFQMMFPGWKVSTTAVAESPVWGVICAAARWRADLIVLEARKSKPHVLLLDDTLKVIHEAPCSTHLARNEGGRTVNSPLNLVAVLEDHSADTIVRAMSEREWPQGSVTKLITAFRTQTTQGTAVAREAEAKLRATGLEVSSLVVEGDLKRVAVEEAKSFGADLIFVGASGRKPFRRPQASLSLHVAANAPCSVEIIRPQHPVN